MLELISLWWGYMADFLAKVFWHSLDQIVFLLYTFPYVPDFNFSHFLLMVNLLFPCILWTSHSPPRLKWHSLLLCGPEMFRTRSDFEAFPCWTRCTVVSNLSFPNVVVHVVTSALLSAIDGVEHFGVIELTMAASLASSSWFLVTSSVIVLCSEMTSLLILSVEI